MGSTEGRCSAPLHSQPLLLQQTPRRLSRARSSGASPSPRVALGLHSSRTNEQRRRTLGTQVERPAIRNHENRTIQFPSTPCAGREACIWRGVCSIPCIRLRRSRRRCSGSAVPPRANICSDPAGQSVIRDCSQYQVYLSTCTLRAYSVNVGKLTTSMFRLDSVHMYMKYRQRFLQNWEGVVYAQRVVQHLHSPGAGGVRAPRILHRHQRPPAVEELTFASASPGRSVAAERDVTTTYSQPSTTYQCVHSFDVARNRNVRNGGKFQSCSPISRLCTDDFVGVDRF